MQVKSRAGRAVLDDYIRRYSEIGGYNRMFFVGHSVEGGGPLSAGDGRADVHVWRDRRGLRCSGRSGPQVCPVHRDEVGVEQRVQIGSEQQAIGDVVGMWAEVGDDVRSLEDAQDAAARYGAASVVGVDQGVAEGLLATAGLDGAEDLLAGVLDARGVEGMRVCIPGRQQHAVDEARLDATGHLDFEAESTEQGQHRGTTASELLRAQRASGGRRYLNATPTIALLS
jgi:hypothetical protein